MREPALLVVEGGPLTTVQDGGRRGRAHEGVPPSGALDRASWRLANRLVGNDPADAVLECTAAGPVLVVEGPPGSMRTLAVTGARAEIRVDGREVGTNTATPVRAGQEVVVGRATEGSRLYLAVSGGIRTEVVLGSRSTDLLSGLGPPALAAGQRLALGVVRGPPPGIDVAPVAYPRPVVELRILPGPRHDWISPVAWTVLVARPWTVRPESNRIGLRLDGPWLERVRSAELAPEGLITGALQLPPAGVPVLFLADHPVTGGYPVLAVVVDDDLDLAGQAGPGTVVVFRLPGLAGRSET